MIWSNPPVPDCHPVLWLCPDPGQLKKTLQKKSTTQHGMSDHQPPAESLRVSRARMYKGKGEVGVVVAAFLQTSLHVRSKLLQESGGTTKPQDSSPPPKWALPSRHGH